ncbi:Methyltransferase type 11 [Solidesulfovibrio fructosivorans JJ]]|uniref:Methyltransferase type 11 n=1 Tax=Solidesulfovibrio fructosivorans JJ] TaxID=596151 RepID=E1JUD3_SOLFR|nr:class I SAM-dependent methyltransferase [Solidesulfovibrio fructosivorans]EFL52063.1 Methyltransferase type 11 [Solidesulfovibrio fructosivorans JJ]]
MRLLVWGTGSRAKQSVPALRTEAMEIVAFIDSFDSGGFFSGKPVLSPGQAAALKPGIDYDGVYIASYFAEEISATAESLGFPKSLFLPECFPHFLRYKERLGEEQFLRLLAVPWWYHAFEILPGIMTPGVCRYKPHLLEHPLARHVAGKRVLDIGAWDGPYTLEMARRGARVTAFDIQPPQQSGFDAMRALNGIDAAHICESVYNLAPDAHGRFDVVLFFGVYYHLRSPLLAIANINAVLEDGGLVFVEGAVLEGAGHVDAYCADNADSIANVAAMPMAYYVKDIFQDHWSNWWVPNMACLRHWFTSSGFTVEHEALFENDSRGYLIARKVGPVPPEHTVLDGPRS